MRHANRAACGIAEQRMPLMETLKRLSRLRLFQTTCSRDLTCGRHALALSKETIDE
jgi:hypothetical protein